MAWKIEWDDLAIKDMRKLDKSIQRMITKYLKNRIENKDNPRRFGKPLGYDKLGLWRYRVEDYRVICRFEDEKMVVLVVQVGHRKKIYD